MAVYYKKVLSDGKTLLKYIPNPVHIGWSRDKNENIAQSLSGNGAKIKYRLTLS